MSNLYTVKPQAEPCSSQPHAKFERRETRVSEFMRLYSTGKIENIPESKIPLEPDDPRSEEQMLNDDFCPTMATEPVEVMQMIEDHLEEYQKAIEEIKAASSRRKRYEKAMQIMRSSTASQADKFEAAKILRELKS